MWLTRALLLVAMLVLPGASRAVERSILQYTHQRWSAESQAPGPVVALAQDRRGYLWAATEIGLYRFDGFRFERIDAAVDLVAHGPPSAVLARRNGDVWVNYERSGRFAIYRQGRLRWMMAPRAPDRVIAMHEAHDSTIWVMTERIGMPLMRYRAGRWTSFGTAAGAPSDNLFSMVLTSEGAVWLSFSESVARLAPGGRRFEIVRRDPDALGRLSIDPEERIWLTERRGTYPITGPGGRGAPPPLRHAYATDPAQIRGRPMFDRQGNLWIATYYDGLQRISRPDPRGAASRAEALSRVERFVEQDGLSSNAMSRLFQDAEGSVWAATESGLDRFWPATVLVEPLLEDAAAFGDLLLSASDGSVYIGQAATVYRVRPGGRPEPIFRSTVEPRTLCEAPDGAIWIGLNDRDVVIWRDGRTRRLGTRAPVTRTIYDCAFDRGGGYWVTASRGGMARYQAGRWQLMSGATGEPFAPRTMVSDAQGRLLVHWDEGTLRRIDGTRATALLPLAGYQPDEVSLFPVRPDTLFIGGRFGLGRLRGGRFDAIAARRVPAFSGITGLVQTPAGETWLAGSAGVARVPTSGLERALVDPRFALPVELFGAADGLRSLPHDHSRRSIVRGGDGRIWIATQTGTMWLDPADISRSRSPPKVAISALTADRLYPDPASVRLPPGGSNVQIDFAVLSFSNPRAARVRYRLEGQDGGWVEAGTRRQAFYTNLAPGHYRFRLIAANDHGVWNAEGATVDIVIPPTFVQSRWFLALCILLVLAVAWLAYRLRMAQVAARIRSGLEERLAERERIARELHDTLLQGVQGLVLRFQSVANKLPDDGAARTHLEAALKRADDIIAEGRDRVQDLRVADGSGDLARLLSERVAMAGLELPIRVVAEGRPRPVHPLVSVELGRIADEALSNIARHARAKSVDIEIRFGGRQLAVEIRDDGIGVEQDVVDAGHRAGHFGVIGMRERAERIGGSFSLDSRRAMGSAVTVTVPARLAYADHKPRHGWRRWRLRGKEGSRRE